MYYFGRHIGLHVGLHSVGFPGPPSALGPVQDFSQVDGQAAGANVDGCLGWDGSMYSAVPAEPTDCAI